MAWRSPIYDRTQADVDYAITKIAEWTAAQLTGQPVVVTELKGCLNVTDIVRIEDNIKYLADMLTSLHYPPNTSSKTWSIDGLPTLADVNRILDNVRAIIEAFYQQENVPEVPKTMLHYTDVNDVELNLLKIKQLLDAMIGSFRKSGTFTCGSSRLLPVWRG
jgi:hypothetical protein